MPMKAFFVMLDKGPFFLFFPIFFFFFSSKIQAYTFMFAAGGLDAY